MAVSLAQQRDEDGFATAYRLVHPGLLGYLRGLVGDDAEDVASDAWLEIARDLGRFRGDGAGFRGWTATIARHRALDHLRKQKRRPRTSLIEQDVLALPGRADTVDAVLESMSTKWALGQIRELPRTRRRLFCCGWWWGWTGLPRRGCWASGPARCGRPPTEG